MSILTLVRHGQAMPFEKDSDRLSPLGETQIRLLGEYWARQRYRVDEVYSGSLVRQRRSAEIAGTAYAAAGLTWPDPQVVKEWNEYDATGLLAKLSPRLAEEDSELARRVAEYHRTEKLPERNRSFQKMFEHLIGRWIEGSLQTPGVESWQEFRARIRRGLEFACRANEGGRQIVVFTSGGPIGTTVQIALKAPEAKAIELNWRVKNASLTNFLFSGERLSLDSFNIASHLDDPTLITYR